MIPVAANATNFAPREKDARWLAWARAGVPRKVVHLELSTGSLQTGRASNGSPYFMSLPQIVLFRLPYSLRQACLPFFNKTSSVLLSTVSRFPLSAYSSSLAVAILLLHSLKQGLSVYFNLCFSSTRRSRTPGLLCSKSTASPSFPLAIRLGNSRLDVRGIRL